MESDEDEVVEEFDIMLSPIDKLLTLFQYPLRTIDRPYGDEGNLTKVSVKRMNNKISMQYDLNKENENYDKNASNHRISCHKLSSTYVPTQTSYWVGTFKNDALYLSPIDLIYQMRPDFEHVDNEAMERMVGGPDVNILRQKKIKDASRMHIVDDGVKEEQRKELELQNEKEVDLQIQDDSEKLINLLTSTPDTLEGGHEVYVLKSEY